MSNYYTPEIEEFHAGFEYFDETLHKKIMPSCEFEYGTITDYYNTYKVKYLDKTDIESLGFKELEIDCYLFPDKSLYGIAFLHSPHNNKVWIFTETKKGSNIGLFAGIIKNKSELKVLLKQLDIL